MQQLRQLGLGCHLGGWWYGAACFADDLFLLAPSRTAANMMLETCEQYAEQHNLEFSTDPNPSKSKSKCIYFTGPARNVVLPEPLQLAGELLLASLLIAQWLGRWCTSLVAKVRSLACLVKSQLLQGGKTLNDTAATYHLFVYYLFMC